MTDIKVKYLGLDLLNPVIVSSSPFTSSAEKIISMEEYGAGAVVLKSLFEEQIIGEAAILDKYSDYPEAADYLNQYVEQGVIKGYYSMIYEAKKHVTIPIIASVNCTGAGSWVEYAKQFEQSGVDALELNIFNFPASANVDPRKIEEQYLDTVASVIQNVGIPVTVKLGMRFTNILSMVREISFRGAKGVVMYNRFFEPDIDTSKLELTTSDSLSSPAELRNVLRMVALCSAQLPSMDISVSSGIHSGNDAIKALLVGASTVQICSTLFINGFGTINRINDTICDWMTEHNFSSIDDFRGSMNSKRVGEESEFYQRFQYMKHFPKQR